MVNYFIKKTIKFFKKKSYNLFPKGQSIVIDHDLNIGKYANIDIENLNISINIGSQVSFRNFCSIVIGKNAKISIGSQVFFNNYCSINCLRAITIGTNTLFGEGVKIYDHNHKYERNPIVKIIPDVFTVDPISIGNNCWIGSNVTILKGVTIGDNVIVGANCLIYKSVLSNTVVMCDNNLVMRS